MTLREIVQIAGQIASGLDAAHAMGLVRSRPEARKRDHWAFWTAQDPRLGTGEVRLARSRDDDAGNQANCNQKRLHTCRRSRPRDSMLITVQTSGRSGR